jgi:hypothetical membrane protein
MSSERDVFVRLGAILGLVAPLLFVLLIVAMAALRPGYSHLTNFISDLGALDAPNPHVQRLNFFQFGIGIAALGVALHRGMDKPSRLALIGQLAIGIGIFLSGIFPGHTGDPASRASMLHNLVGVPAFLLIMLVPLVAGSRFRQIEEWRPLSHYSMVMTPLLVIFFVLMARADAAGGSPGMYQRLFIGTWMLWMVAIALRLLGLQRANS